MVAEAIPETEVTPPEDVAVTTPESTPESTPAPETNEEPSVIDAILESFGEGEGTGADDGKGLATDGKVPPAEVALTPEEAKAQGRREAEAEIANRQTTAQRQAYLDGVRRSFQAVDAELDAKADEWGLTTEGRQWLRGRFQAHNGHWGVLHQAALNEASPEIKIQGFNEGVMDASEKAWTGIKEELGEPALKAIQTAKPDTWADLAKAVAKEARKGYVPSSDYVSKASAKAQLDKLEAALKDRGASGIVTRSLADLTGGTGPDTPAARGGSGGRMTKAAFDALPIDEQLKVPAAERARIYGAVQR